MQVPLWNERVSLIVGLVTLGGFIYGGYRYFDDKVHSHNLNGDWKFTFHVKSSTLKSTIGTRFGYKILVHTDKEKFEAKGEKFWINEETIPYAEHDRIEFTGTLSEESIHSIYTLYGSKRTTVGDIDMNVIDDNTMEGTFVGTAADTKGTVSAVRL